jgi:HTH-type transcriptional regulator/antitoxin HigA
MHEFPLREIKNKRDEAAATEILDRLVRDHYDDPGEEAYVSVLLNLVVAYEAKNEPPRDERSGLAALLYLVEEQKIRQSELAAILGVTQAAVSMILRGERQITADHARKLGKRFGMEPGTFI